MRPEINKSSKLRIINISLIKNRCKSSEYVVNSRDKQHNTIVGSLFFLVYFYEIIKHNRKLVCYAELTQHLFSDSN